MTGRCGVGANASRTSEKEKSLVGREPTTCGFERQRLSPTPCRPAVFVQFINHMPRKGNKIQQVGVV